MTVKDEFSKRLRTAMKAAGIKPSGTELERAFSLQWRGPPISVQTAANWINGKYLPRQDKLRVLARVLKIDPRTLMYGAPEPLAVAEARRGWEDRSTYAERQTIETFLGLPAPQRLIVRDVINGFAMANGAVRSEKE